MSIASIPFVCEHCGARFLPQSGGVCERCRRVLCMRHFRFWDGVRARFAGKPMACRTCLGTGAEERSLAAGPSPGPPGEGHLERE